MDASAATTLDERQAPTPAPPPEQRPFPFEVPTPADEAAIRKQLGDRGMPGKIGVARRCCWGYPQAVVNAPLLVGPRLSVASTLTRLTCPLLVAAVNELEHEKQIERYDERVRRDPKLWRELEATHRSAARDRVALLPAEWRQRLARDPQLAHFRWVLYETGLSGISRTDHIKCLHAHLADYLGRTDNPIGRKVAATLRARGIPLEGTRECWRYCTPAEGA